MRRYTVPLALALTVGAACEATLVVPPPDEVDAGAVDDDAARPEAPRDAGPGGPVTPPPDGAAPAPPCVAGTLCAPRRIDALPYLDTADTAAAPGDVIDAYGCAPATDEGGPEVVYAVDVAEVGLLGAQVHTFTDGVDVDVHILAGASPAADCLARAHRATNALVEPGRYFVVVDTWVDDAGVARAGAYELEVRFRPVPEIDCALSPRDLRMYWSSCDAGLDCAATSEGIFLHTPSVGPVVLEAHLVTVDDPFDGWPASGEDHLADHYALSQHVTDYVMDRDQIWAPYGEGGSMWGQGATGGRVPAGDEAFYVNMYWRDRPSGGTRMLARDPVSGLAVVVSAGWETGPGNNAHIGGTTEEVHDYLGTTHRDPLELGFLIDQGAPLGPVRCRP